MKAKKFIVLITKGPVGTEAGSLGLDAALAAAAFDQDVTMLFKDEGLLQLLQNQAPQLLGNKSTLANFGLMNMYGVTRVWAAQSSAESLQLNDTHLAHAPEFVSDEIIDEALQSADHVWIY